MVAGILEQALMWFPEAAVAAFDAEEHPITRIVCGIITAIAACMFAALCVGLVYLVVHGV